MCPCVLSQYQTLNNNVSLRHTKIKKKGVAMVGENRFLGQGQTGNSSRLHTFSDSRMCIMLCIVYLTA